MKTIGLVGGMSWESTVTYYQIINRTVQRTLGGVHSARILLQSIDFYDLEQQIAAGKWDEAALLVGDAAVTLEAGGADFIVICANTAHKVAAEVQRRLRVPLLHVAKIVAETLSKRGHKRAALLGTAYTLKETFYTSVLRHCGLEVLIPEADDIASLNQVIYGELCRGIFSQKSRELCAGIIRRMQQNGAEAVILGCTELGLLLSAKDSVLPVFDSTLLHAQAAAALALEEEIL